MYMELFLIGLESNESINTKKDRIDMQPFYIWKEDV